MDKNYENMGPMDSTAVQMVSAVGGYGTPAEMYDAVVQAYIAQNQHMNVHYLVEHAYQIAGDLMREITVNIDQHNDADKKHHKWTVPPTLPPTCAARLILASGDVVIIKLTSNKSLRRLAIRGYDENGNITGIWIMDTDDDKCSTLSGLVRAIMSAEATKSKVDNCRASIMDELTRRGMIYEEGWNKDLMVFFNGVWDGVKREFTYFTDKDYEAKYGSYHFLSKMDTDWNPNAKEKPYFKVLDFIRSVMPDGELGDVQAQMILYSMNFTMRRYSGDDGNIVELTNALERADGKNGKTTLAEMLLTAIDHGWGKDYSARTDKKNVGENNGPKVVTVPVTDWDKDFMLTEVVGTGAYAIISDDADDVPIADGVFKNIARGQSLQINRKGKDPATYLMHLVAWILQNGRLKVKNKMNSSFTHQLGYDMNKIFSKDEINKDIKTKYIVEEETMEFFLHYLATEVPWVDDYPDELVDKMKGAVADMKNANIPTYRALDDIMYGLRMCPRIQCDFIFELYHGWCEQNGVDYNLTSNDFWKDAVQWVKDHSDDYEIQNVKQDRIKVKKDYKIRDKEYKVNADGTPVMVDASEWEILFERLHPAVIQYGHPTKRWGAPRLVKIRKSFRGDDYVFGAFDSHAITGKKLSRFIVNKHPVAGYDELFDDDAKRSEMKDRYSTMATQNFDEKTEVETNHPNEAAAIVALRQVSC